MKNLLVVVCIALCFLCCKKKSNPQPQPPADTVTTPADQGKILWDGDAAKGNQVWKVASNIEGEGTISTITDPTYGLTWKFAKPLGSHRTESHGAKGFQAAEGDDIYIGWRCKISMPPNINTNAVFQWKAYGDDMQQNFPVIISTTTGGDIHLMHYAPGQVGAELWKTQLKINVWNRFVLRLKISRDGTVGFIEFWYNGEKQMLKGGTQRYYGRTLDAEYCDPKWGVYGGDAQLITNYVNTPRIASSYALAEHVKLTEPDPDPVPPPATTPVDPASLTLYKTVTASSQLSGAKASAAVDDDLDTYWQPLAGDRDDKNIWISADLGEAKTFNTMRVFWNRADFISKYQVLYSNDGTNWTTAYEKTSGFSTIEKCTFTPVTARYVKLNVDMSECGSNLTTAEWRIFNE